MKMRKIIVVATITACFALCTAVWPQNEADKEVPIPTPAPAVCAVKATSEEQQTEMDSEPPAEAEMVELPQSEQPEQAAPIPEPALTKTSIVLEDQCISEPEPIPEQTTGQPATQEIAEPPSGDMVYVPGFGWIKNEGPNHVEYEADMYENGNKIGIMG